MIAGELELVPLRGRKNYNKAENSIKEGLNPCLVSRQSHPERPVCGRAESTIVVQNKESKGMSERIAHVFRGEMNTPRSYKCSSLSSCSTSLRNTSFTFRAVVELIRELETPAKYR